MINEAEIYRQFQSALNRMAERGQDEVRDQGHIATGAGLKSIQGMITRRNLELLVGAILANDYMVDKVDPGVSPSQVPPRVRHVNALLQWAESVKPGLVLSERIRFANAVASKHYIEGIPTKASFRFSKNKRRTGWIKAAFEDPEAVQEFQDLTNLIKIFTDGFFQSIGETA